MIILNHTLSNAFNFVQSSNNKLSRFGFIKKRIRFELQQLKNQLFTSISAARILGRRMRTVRVDRSDAIFTAFLVFEQRSRHLHFCFHRCFRLSCSWRNVDTIKQECKTVSLIDSTISKFQPSLPGCWRKRSFIILILPAGRLGRHFIHRNVMGSSMWWTCRRPFNSLIATIQNESGNWDQMSASK